MAGGEQHTSLQGFDGGVGTVGIFEVQLFGVGVCVDHGHCSGENGSVDDGLEHVELDGDDSSYDGDLHWSLLF